MRPNRRFVVATVIAALLAAALWAAPAVGAETYLDGVDVSRWQGKPKWALVKAAGVRFVIAKATQGTDWVDPQYSRNRTKLRANSLPFTAYHYAEPEATPGDAIAEADHFVDTARLNGRNLLPVLDLERDGGLTPDALAEWVQTWLARVEARLGVKAMIYTNTPFWVERMGDTPEFAEQGHRLWIRHLGAEAPTLPATNWGGHGWTIWQHAVVGGLDGFNGKVDRDRYAGTGLAPIKIKNNR